MIDLPPHVYIPGHTPRHPEDWFDVVKAGITDDIPPDALHKTDAFRAGLYYLREGYFWECHEVLEAVWMRCPPGTAEREMTQAVIQLANARLKHLMGKPHAVRRLCERVAAHLAKCPSDRPVLGLRVAQVSAWLAETQELLVV